MIFLKLFWEFFKTGLFAIGGGLATVPFLQDIAVRTGWYTAGQLADMIAVSESTPGPMGVNMATYVGYTIGSGIGGAGLGIFGAITATLGLITPSVIVILVIAYFLKKFRDNPLVNNTLYGLRPASVALITAAGLNIALFALFRADGIRNLAQARLNPVHIGLAAVILVLTRWCKPTKKLHPVWFIVFAAIVGVVLKMG